MSDSPASRHRLSLTRSASGGPLAWEHFAHGADIGVRGSGATPGEAFEQAALALTAVVADPAQIASDTALDIQCEAPDLELLLADWLNALIYEMATRNMLFVRFEVRIAGSSLNAKAWGEALDRSRHQPTVEVKGATYTALSVARRDDVTTVGVPGCDAIVAMRVARLGHDAGVVSAIGEDESDVGVHSRCSL